MTPTYEELLEGSTNWRKEQDGVSILLNHHAYSNRPDFPHPGIWCYYLLIPEQMYPHRWQDFATRRSEHGYEHHGPAFDHDMFDSEITFAQSKPYWDRKTERQWDGVKVGCDYNHLWHSERGYSDTYHTVFSDAKQTVSKFLAVNPDRRLRCAYSGVWGEPDDFYTAQNGRKVHKGAKLPQEWTGWKPLPEPQPRA